MQVIVGEKGGIIRDYLKFDYMRIIEIPLFTMNLNSLNSTIK